jgi:hypothetical protein
MAYTPSRYTNGIPPACTIGRYSAVRTAISGATSGSSIPTYVDSAAIGCLRQMNVPTISDSRVQERFQRSCCVMNCLNSLGTIVCETARDS